METAKDDLAGLRLAICSKSPYERKHEFLGQCMKEGLG
jgi:hypothetical protein